MALLNRDLLADRCRVGILPGLDRYFTSVIAGTLKESRVVIWKREIFDLATNKAEQVFCGKLPPVNPNPMDETPEWW